MATLTIKNIDAENTFTDPQRLEGYFNLSLSGTWAATVTVQRSVDGSTNWVDVDAFTVPTEEYGFEPEFMWYRVGVKTGAFTSGTVVVRLGREDKDRH
jgi:hypothetical protein